jgi:hypothetical protein
VSRLERFEGILCSGERVVKLESHRPRLASAGCLDEGDRLRGDSLFASERAQALW